MRLSGAALGVVALLFASPALAENGIEAGLAEVEVELDPLADCEVGVSPELCLLAWDDGGTADPGDDTFSAYRGIDRVAVRVESPLGGPTGSFHFDTRQQAIEHGGFVLLNNTWVGLNNALPPEVREYFTLESRPIKPNPDHWYIFPAFHMPVVVQVPFGGPAAEHFVPFYVMWDTWYTDYTHVYPFGRSGLNSQFGDEEDAGQFDSDRLVEQLRPLAGECAARFYAPSACGPWDQWASPAVDGALALQARVTPKVLLGFALNTTDVQLAPATAAAPAVGDGAGRDGALDTVDGAAGAVLPSPDAMLLAPIGETLPLGASPPFQARSPQVDPAPGLSAAATLFGEDPPLVLALLALGIGLAFFALLYHRIQHKSVLLQETRRHIYGFITANPGTRTGTIATLMGVDYKTAQWHVCTLKAHGLVSTGGEGAHARLFAAATPLGRSEREALLASSTPVARVVLDYVRRHGRAEMSAMRRELDLPASSASVAVARLSRAGLVATRRAGRQLVLSMPPPAM